VFTIDPTLRLSLDTPEFMCRRYPKRQASFNLPLKFSKFFGGPVNSLLSKIAGIAYFSKLLQDIGARVWKYLIASLLSIKRIERLALA
jgi:hypothetical protein